MSNETLTRHLAAIPYEDKLDLLNYLHSEKAVWLKKYLQHLAVTIEYPSWQMTFFTSRDLDDAEHELADVVAKGSTTQEPIWSDQCNSLQGKQ